MGVRTRQRDHGWDYFTVSLAPGVKDALREEATKRGVSLSHLFREGASAVLNQTGPSQHPPQGRRPVSAVASGELDDALGHWLAGYIDGEGSFSIVKGPRGVFKCVFQLTSRVDDAETLEMLRDRTGLGAVYRNKNSRSVTNANPTATWAINRKQHIGALVQIIDRYPLRAKKRRDYEIWREAVLLWSAYSGNRWTPPELAPWNRMAALKEELRVVRAFHPPTA